MRRCRQLCTCAGAENVWVGLAQKKKEECEHKKIGSAMTIRSKQAAIGKTAA